MSTATARATGHAAGDASTDDTADADASDGADTVAASAAGACGGGGGLSHHHSTQQDALSTVSPGRRSRPASANDPRLLLLHPPPSHSAANAAAGTPPLLLHRCHQHDAHPSASAAASAAAAAVPTLPLFDAPSPTTPPADVSLAFPLHSLGATGPAAPQATPYVVRRAGSTASAGSADTAVRATAIDVLADRAATPRRGLGSLLAGVRRPPGFLQSFKSRTQSFDDRRRVVDPDRDRQHSHQQPASAAPLRPESP
ncbi:hypothetical protein HK405_011669, partial [Cladochytrium tenue]